MNEYIIQAHDEEAFIFDIFNYKKFKEGNEYLDCIIDKTDMETYNDLNVGELHSKMMRNLEKIIKAIENKNFNKAIELEGFCLIIEKYK